VWSKQKLPDDVTLCHVYTRLAVVSRLARSFHDTELEELREFGLRDNATLVDSIRNLTTNPTHGLETQLRNAKWKLKQTNPRGRMCVRMCGLLTCGRLEPSILRNLEGRPPRFRNGRKRHKRQLRKARKMVRHLRHLKYLIRQELAARGAL